MIDIVYYLFNSLGTSSQPGGLMLPEWVKVRKKRFNQILSTVTKAKNEELKANVDGREITLYNTKSWLKDLGNGIFDGHECKNRYNDIANNVEAIVNRPIITINQKNKRKTSRNYVAVKRNSKTQMMNNQTLQTCLN